MSPSTKNRRNQEIKKSGKIYKNANTTARKPEKMARKPEKMARIFKIKSLIDKLMMVPLAILKKNKNSNKYNNKKNRKKTLACKHQQRSNNNSNPPNQI
jgi:hypothetical protein